MANQSVLLLKPLEHLGAEGEEVNVRAGYARNFLIPKKLAVPLTLSNRRYIEALNQRRVEREREELAGAERLAAQIKKSSIAIAVKTGEGGKMFGSVTIPNILERLQEEGIELDRKQVHTDGPIKELGRHQVTVKLHADVQVTMNIEVVSENPIEEEQ